MKIRFLKNILCGTLFIHFYACDNYLDNNLMKKGEKVITEEERRMKQVEWKHICRLQVDKEAWEYKDRPYRNEYFNISYSPDEKYIAIGRSVTRIFPENPLSILHTPALYICDLSKRIVSQTFDDIDESYESKFNSYLYTICVDSLSYSPDGKYLASTWRIKAPWDIRNLYCPCLQQKIISKCSHIPRSLWDNSQSDDLLLIIWNIDTGKIFKKFKNQKNIFRIQYSPNGEYFTTSHSATSTSNSLERGITEEAIRKNFEQMALLEETRIYSTSTWEFLYKINICTSPRHSLSNKFIYFYRGCSLEIYEISTGEKLKELSLGFNLCKFICSPNGRYLACSYTDENENKDRAYLRIKVIDINTVPIYYLPSLSYGRGCVDSIRSTVQEFKFIWNKSNPYPSEMSFLANPNYIAIKHRDSLSFAISILDLETGMHLLTYKSDKYTLRGYPILSPNGKSLVYYYDDKICYENNFIDIFEFDEEVGYMSKYRQLEKFKSDLRELYYLIPLESSKIDFESFAKKTLSSMEENSSLSKSYLEYKKTEEENKIIEKEESPVLSAKVNEFMDGFLSEMELLITEIPEESRPTMKNCNFDIMRPHVAEFIQAYEFEKIQESTDRHLKELALKDASFEKSSSSLLAAMQKSKTELKKDTSSQSLGEISKDKSEETRYVLTLENYFIPIALTYDLSEVKEDISYFMEDTSYYLDSIEKKLLPPQHLEQLLKILSDIHNMIRKINPFYRDLKKSSKKIFSDIDLGYLELDLNEVFHKKINKSNTEAYSASLILDNFDTAKKLLFDLKNEKEKLLSILKMNNSISLKEEKIEYRDFYNSDEENDYSTLELNTYLNSFLEIRQTEEDKWFTNSLNKTFTKEFSYILESVNTEDYFHLDKCVSILQKLPSLVKMSDLYMKKNHADLNVRKNLRGDLMKSIMMCIPETNPYFFKPKRFNDIKKNIHKLESAIDDFLNNF